MAVIVKVVDEPFSNVLTYMNFSLETHVDNLEGIVKNQPRINDPVKNDCLK